jgi:hypothetical protein
VIDWESLPPDVASMFNPAFIGEIIRRTGQAYEEEAAKPMPFILAFLAVPLLIFSDTRNTLEARRHRQLHSWIQMHPEVRVQLALKARELAPYVRQAMAFAINYKSLQLTEQGEISVLPRIKKRGVRVLPINSSDYMTKAGVLGKLFGRVDQDHNIFVMLGVRP